MDEAVLVDNNHIATRVIKKNLQITKETFKFEVLNSSSDAAVNLLANRHEKFRLIFLDPPYANQSIEKDIEHIINQDLLDDVALIVCEVASEVTLPEEIKGIHLWNKRKFGKSKLYIYQQINSTDKGD